MRHRIKYGIRQWFAGFLSVVMLISMLPVTAYAEGEGAPEKTAIEQIQELIDALPNAEEITADSQTAVREQLDAIDAALSELDGEETAKLDAARYEAALSALSALDGTTGDETEKNGADPNNRKGTTPVPESNESKETGSDTVTGGDLHTGTAVKRVQSMIDALPDAETVTADNRADVEAQLTAIDEAKLALSQEELDALDITRYNDVVSALLSLDGMAGAAVPMTIEAENYYLDWDATSQKLVQKNFPGSFIPVTNSTSSWSNGWYVVDGDITISDRISVSGSVNLILKDSGSLTASKGIIVNSGNSLTIYAQSEDADIMGVLKAAGSSYSAGIGGGRKEAGGTVTINGGAVTASSRGGAAGIGGGYEGAGGTVTINGGIVTASSSSNTGTTGAGIGGGYKGAGGTVTINGGIVTASSSNGAGIGGGYYNVGGTVTINGGIVTASSSYGIGIGRGNGGGDDSNFSTGASGNAVIHTNSIEDQNGKSSWSGIIFIGNEGQVYGTPTPAYDFEVKAEETLKVPQGHPLHIAAGVTMTNNGTIQVGSSSDLNAVLNNEGAVNNGGTIDVYGQLANGEKGITKIGEGKIVYHFNLDVTAPVFADTTYGSSRPPAQAITITNNDEKEAYISKVELVGGDFSFVQEGGTNTKLAKGAINTSWTIQPNAGLSVGTHTAEISVSYQIGGTSRTSKAEVSFTVTQAVPTVKVTAAAADGEPTYGDDITLTATVSAAGVKAADMMDAGGKVTFQAGSVSLGTAELQTVTSAGTSEEVKATLTIFGTDREKQKALFGEGSDTVVTAQYSGNGKVQPSEETAKVTMKPKELTFSFHPNNRVYDETTVLKGSFDDFSGQLVTEGGEQDEVKVESYTANAESADVGNGKTVTVTEIKLGGADAKYYTPGAVTCGTVDIYPAASTVTDVPTGETGLTYTGEALKLLSGEAECAGGSMRYYVGAKDDSSEPGLEAVWKEDLSDLTATDAGTYTVWYYVKGDANHSDTKPASLTVTINKAQATVTTAPAGKLVYGEDVILTAVIHSDSVEAAQAEQITGEVAFQIGETILGTAEVQDVAMADGTSGGISIVRAATLTISGSDRERQHTLFGTDSSTALTLTASYTSGNDSINSGADATGTSVAMERKILRYTVTAADKIYDDSAEVVVSLAPVNGVSDDDVTLTAKGHLTSGDAGEYSTVNLSDIQIEGGDVKYYTVETAADDVPLAAPVRITKKEAEVTVLPTGAENLTYTGEALTLLSGEAECIGGSMRYYVGAKDDSSEPGPDAAWKENLSDLAATDAGTYTVWYYVKGDANHSDTPPASLTVTVEKAEGRGRVALKGYFCGDTDVDPEAESDTNGTENVTYLYREKGAEDSAYSENKPLVAGEYTVKAVFAETANYKEAEAEADFTVTHRFDADWNVEKDGVYQTCPCHTDFRLTESGLTEVPEALRENEVLNTPDKIVKALTQEAAEQVPIPEQNSVVYDVKLLIKDSGSLDWTEATEENFPEKGIDVILPYPEGTDSSYTFTVIHMISAGEKAGQTEKLDVTNTEQGISFTVKSLSPFYIGWTAPSLPAIETPSEEDDEETELGIVTQQAFAFAGAAAEKSMVKADGANPKSTLAGATHEPEGHKENDAGQKESASDGSRETEETGAVQETEETGAVQEADETLSVQSDSDLNSHFGIWILAILLLLLAFLAMIFLLLKRRKEENED